MKTCASFHVLKIGAGLLCLAAVALAALTPYATVFAGPFDEPALHDAPRAPLPAPDPNPPKGEPKEKFFRELIQSRSEGNSGGRTRLIEIHKFKKGAPREAGIDETQPRASSSMVTPILVQWTSTSYGQTDTTTKEYEQMWICWKNEVGVWVTGTTGSPLREGPIKSKDHPSIP